jgi:glycine/D-amino acid oxidase-like deaminating enzyme
MTSRRQHGPGGPGTLVCLGGPETELDDAAVYDPDQPVPVEVIAEFDTDVRPILWPARPAGLEYDYAWHGLMAYTESRVRLIGCEPRNPVLLYNLGCNGVGFLPSIYGGMRAAQLVRGDQLEPSIFDPQ